MTNAFTVFAKTEPNNIADNAPYHAVINLLQRSSLSSVLALGHEKSIDNLLDELQQNQKDIATLNNEVKRLDKLLKTKQPKEK